MPATDAQSELDSNGTRPQVLVIDDFAGARDLIAFMLKREGFDVLEAEDGPTGLTLAREARPVAIVLDVVMPGMDGWAVLQQLKSDPELAAIPVILATVLEEQSKGYVFGATDYLTKPLNPKALSALLNRYLQDRDAGPVLVVEDDQGTREITAWVLEREGWQVSEASNGREALEQVAAQRPQLILLDLIMPEMDGFEFIDRLCAMPFGREIPIVVVTAHDLNADEGSYLQNHVSQVLQKGAHSREDLLETIGKLVHRSCPPQ
jgi:adenylate cyclase